jgi:carbon-monoxide dehydrogenase large subunit
MNRFGIGQPVRRVEDERFLTGSGCFLDDVELGRQCHAVLVLSPHPHALVKSIDTSEALQSEGVVCVLTGEDVVADGLVSMMPRVMTEDFGGPKGYRTPRPILARDRVRCVGDRVAVVVAETEAQARAAAELVAVDYEPLPSVVDVEVALSEHAPQLWPDCPTGNVCCSIGFGDRAATNAAFDAAAVVVSRRLVNNRVSANSLEPRGAIGLYRASDRSFTLYASSQNPHGARAVAAEVLKVSETQIRVIAPDVGGGFGLKGNPHPEDVLVLWAARRCRRTVKWIPTRSESLMSDCHGRDQIVYAEMALAADGTVLGLRIRAMQAVGAYIAATGAIPLLFSMRFLPNVYDIRAVDLETRGVFTNTSPMTSYRGAGRPEAAYVIERLLDRAARELGIDPVEIRRRNFIRPEEMPYRTATGYVYDSGEFDRIMKRCLDLADWTGFPARRDRSKARGRLRGRAVSYYIEQGGNFNDRMELRFDPGGTVTIVAGTHSHGQGHATTYAQMVSEWLGVPFAAIRFVQGDTDAVPFGRGTFAARSSMIGGCALLMAANGIIAKAKLMAAAMLEAAPEDMAFANGTFNIVGTDRSIALLDVAKAFYAPAGLVDKFGVGLEASGSFATDPPNHPNGCHACEIEVDPETGSVLVDRYTVVDDVGRIINPMICEGQVHGGLAQGIGQALLEEIVYDRASGQLVTGSFMDYGMPRASDFPEFTVGFEEVHCTTNPLGIKGIGEAGAIGTPPTIINAILDALHPLGVDHIEMPASPSRVWQAMENARAKKGLGDA